MEVELIIEIIDEGDKPEGPDALCCKTGLAALKT